MWAALPVPAVTHTPSLALLLLHPSGTQVWRATRAFPAVPCHPSGKPLIPQQGRQEQRCPCRGAVLGRPSVPQPHLPLILPREAPGARPSRNQGSKCISHQHLFNPRPGCDGKAHGGTSTWSRAGNTALYPTARPFPPSPVCTELRQQSAFSRA